MSEEYGEAKRRHSLLFYAGGAVIGTILVDGMLRFMFGIDITGGSIDFIASLPEMVSMQAGLMSLFHTGLDVQAGASPNLFLI